MDQGALEGRSLYMFGAKSKIRRVIFKVVNASWFETLIIVMILTSSILLALEDPLKDNTNTILSIIDMIITIVFMIEAGLKIVAYGFIINGDQSYMR